MSSSDEKLRNLRNLINENLRTQVDSDDVSYVSATHTLSDVSAKQSHCIFARRGCGKTLLLHQSRKGLGKDVRAIYINCEDFKHHTFPNVLIEILNSIFSEVEKKLTTWWPSGGKRKKLKVIVSELRKDLNKLKENPDIRDLDVRENSAESEEDKLSLSSDGGFDAGVGVDFKASLSNGSIQKKSSEVEMKYKHNESKLVQLNHKLPEYKEKIKNFFEICNDTKSIFIQIDDFYHLTSVDQPYVADYVHRLCKDTKLKFKIATLKHNSVLYIERNKQPIGIQERHDYQPINIDFTFENFTKTREQNRGIFLEYARLAGLSVAEFDGLFKGEGFDRLIMAGGGVPRDSLSFFLEVLDNVRRNDGDGRIGKDDVRFLSRQTFENRINELKQDSEGQDQAALLRGIYVIRSFCLEKKCNIFLVREEDIQNNDEFKTLLYRLLDYRIIHQVARSLTHKSVTGHNFQAFAIDIGCYAYMRNLQGRMVEIDITDPAAKEKMRSAPIFELFGFRKYWGEALVDVEGALMDQESEPQGVVA